MANRRVQETTACGTRKSAEETRGKRSGAELVNVVE